MEQLISDNQKNFEQRLNKIEQNLVILEQSIKDLQQQDSISIVCVSGEWDKLFAAFTIANGALSLGREVNMFFTFWGATAMRDKNGKSSKRKNLSQKLLELISMYERSMKQDLFLIGIIHHYLPIQGGCFLRFQRFRAQYSMKHSSGQNSG